MDPMKHEQAGEEAITGWRQHRFFLLVGGSILIACFLVFISLELYSWSGAAQLDLSLPSYNGVRNKITADTSTTYPSTGPMDAQALSNFRSLYNDQVKQAQGGDGFNTAALSDDSLGIHSSTQATQ